jgi:hypothetical protein
MATIFSKGKDLIRGVVRLAHPVTDLYHEIEFLLEILLCGREPWIFFDLEQLSPILAARGKPSFVRLPVPPPVRGGFPRPLTGFYVSQAGSGQVA